MLDEANFVYLVRNFTDDDLFFPRALYGLGEGLSAHLHDAFAFMVSLHNRFLAMNESRSGKIRPGNMLHQLRNRDIGIFD